MSHCYFTCVISLMRYLTFILLSSVIIVQSTFGQTRNTDIVTDDIDHFWQAYDQIIITGDSVRQYAYLNTLFLQKGTPGLKAIMQARDYTAKSYLDAINKYPLFWKSIRPNMHKARGFAGQIAKNVANLKKLYPYLKPAKIYFTVGAFRTGGTTLDSLVLIGSEIAMADEHTETSEFAGTYPNFNTYFKTNPINSTVFTNVHEYVHTQQKTTIGNSLLAQSVLEGVAEFMAEKATGTASTLPALPYGREHNNRIRQVFEAQMFNTAYGFWLYSNAVNEFGFRDLGYYVGYAICEKYYNQAADKQQAIKEMIQLDYNDDAALWKFANSSGYFSKPMALLHTDYEASRPYVTGISELKGKDATLSPSVTLLTIKFSAVMDKRRRSFELGPLGKDNLMQVKNFVGFADDGRSATIGVELKPGRRYQLVVGDGFMSADGIMLKPYLIDFKTAAN